MFLNQLNKIVLTLIIQKQNFKNKKKKIIHIFYLNIYFFEKVEDSILYSPNKGGRACWIVFLEGWTYSWRISSLQIVSKYLSARQSTPAVYWSISED